MKSGAFSSNGIFGRILMVLLGLTVSCTHRQPERTAPPLSLPSAYVHGSDTNAAPSDWWRVFNDEELNRLIQAAFSNNWSLKQSAARVEQSRALAVQAGAVLSPDLTLNAGVSRSKSVSTSTATGESTSRTRRQYRLSLAAAYEVDLWGRLRSLRRAALLELEASEDNRAAVRLSLAAQTADTWYALNTSVAQLALIRDQEEVSRQYVELTEAQFRRGQASAVDVYQQRQQLENIRALVPEAERRAQTTRHALAVLLGRTPQAAGPKAPGRLPDLAPESTQGVPADLLIARPDVRAVFHQLAAADEQLYAAAMNRLPALRLTGSLGYQSTSLGDVLDDWIWNLAGELAAPLIDGRRRESEEQRRRAIVHEWRAVAGDTLLTALREVEDALYSEQKQHETVDSFQTRIALAEQTLAQTRKRYLRGVGDYLPVLTALSSLQTLQRNALDAQRQLVSYRIQLYRALGEGLNPIEE